ncbi:MAG: MCE family protein [Actinomycetota bacterium]|nr:MCE family protein [Actinomycetota bacterium]MDQ5807298.1 MCE family protein [Actinomycetota bacterium]
MQKQAPTLGRLLTMVLFALSCFGLLLFLWLAFGGPVPLKPKGYQFKVAVPEANQLAIEADVRSSGVPIGKIKALEQAEAGNKTLVTVELERKYAPLDADARVIQRQKTILGEKYLELTRGTPGGPQIKEGGRLPDAAVEDTVELDEVLGILDEPTRNFFKAWQQDTGEAITDRGEDLNDAFGNLPQFVASGSDVLEVLNDHDNAIRGLVRNTGVVFGALTEREDQLRALMVNMDDAFTATAEQKEALADTFAIFPTFLDESRLTMEDLESFSRQTRPLVRDLRPALRDLRPTLRDLRALAPDLTNFYRDLDPLITVSRRGLPALRDVLQGARPLLRQLQPFLEELNPILEWLEYHQHTVTTFFSNGGGAVIDTVQGLQTEEERGHYLGQFGVTGEETFNALQPRRPDDQRGNAYPDPTMVLGDEVGRRFIIANWDCSNTGKPGNGEYTTQKGDTSDIPSCWEKALPGPTRFPHIQKADYSKGG